MEAQIREWKAKFEAMDEKATRATGETKAELLQAIHELRRKNEAL